MTKTSSTKHAQTRHSLSGAAQERLDATPERLLRAREAGQAATRDIDRLRRIIDPFDVMRSNRLLAPHDQKLNDIRWLVGEALRRTHHRARLDTLRAVVTDRIGSTGFGPRPGLPQAEAALHARDKLRRAEEKAGPHAWPIVARIVIEGAGVKDCRGFIPELATPWRADAVVTDRLRCALDSLGPLLGVTLGNRVNLRRLWRGRRRRERQARPAAEQTRMSSAAGLAPVASTHDEEGGMRCGPLQPKEQA